MNRLMQVQVRYAQGAVKTFIAPAETTLADFRGAVEAMSSRIKSVRFLPDVVDAQAADFLVQSGNAVLIGARR